jgi:hypothetical protein
MQGGPFSRVPGDVRPSSEAEFGRCGRSVRGDVFCTDVNLVVRFAALVFGAGAAGLIGGALLNEAFDDDEPDMIVNSCYKD